MNRFGRTFIALTLYTVFVGNMAANALGSPLIPQINSSAGSDLERGLALAERGDYKNAITSLREATKKNKQDPDAWCALGLSYSKYHRHKDAENALRTAIKLRPNFATAHSGLAFSALIQGRNEIAKKESELALSIAPEDLHVHYVYGLVLLANGRADRAIEEADAVNRIDPKFGPAYFLRASAILGNYGLKFIHDNASRSENQLSAEEQASIAEVERNKLAVAAKNLETYLSLMPAIPDAVFVHDRIEALTFYSKNPLKDGTGSFRPTAVTTKAKVLAKPEPAYTESAKKSGVVGKVVLKVVLAEDTTVKYILPLVTLPSGLTEKAIEAARKIRFTPAIRDGKPVPQSIYVEYNFNLY
jgi:Tfp pilus assembly protein PilF